MALQVTSGSSKEELQWSCSWGAAAKPGVDTMALQLGSNNNNKDCSVRSSVQEL